MNYATDTDLLVFRPNVLDYGVADWTAQHAEAKRRIDRLLDVRWYRPQAAERGLDWRATPFDSDRLLQAANQLKTLAVYAAFSLVYGYLTRDGEADVFERLRGVYEALFERELEAVLAEGLDYDWDDSAAIDDDERQGRTWPNRLVRA